MQAGSCRRFLPDDLAVVKWKCGTYCVRLCNSQHHSRDLYAENLSGVTADALMISAGYGFKWQ